MYWVIREALVGSRLTEPGLRAPLYVWGIRGGRVPGSLPCAVPGPAPKDSGRGAVAWEGSFESVALDSRGAPDRALEAHGSPFPGWLCHQPTQGLHAEARRFSCEGRRCSTWNQEGRLGSGSKLRSGPQDLGRRGPVGHLGFEASCVDADPWRSPCLPSVSGGPLRIRLGSARRLRCAALARCGRLRTQEEACALVQMHALPARGHD